MTHALLCLPAPERILFIRIRVLPCSDIACDQSGHHWNGHRSYPRRRQPAGARPLSYGKIARRKAIEEVMSGLGMFPDNLADDPSLRWLGPHKGVVHLALAAITNACFDLWAKSRGVPCEAAAGFKPEEVVQLLDLAISMSVEQTRCSCIAQRGI